VSSMESIDRFIDDQIAGGGDDVEDEEFVEEPAAEAGADDEAPEAAPLLAGKYKDVDALVNAYKELERQFHESRQPQADAEDDDAEEEWEDEDVLAMPLPLGGEPQNDQQFWGWFNQSPQDAALWAVQNADRVGAQFVREAVDGWAAVDPTGHATMVAQAQVWEAQQRMQAAYEERIAALEQRLTPHEQRLQADYVEVARAAVEARVPDQADRAAAMQMIKDTPMLLQAWNAAQTPQQMADVAGFAANQIAFQRMQTDAAQASPQRRATTRTRQGSAPAPSAAGDEAAAIIAAANSAIGEMR